MVKHVFVFACLFLCFQPLFAKESLTMVYRTTAKEPFIAEEPSNEGIWKAVYTQAAKKIGLELTIERYPKKRAYSLLDKGEVDFYPASSFNPSREKTGYFINNWLSKEGVTVLYRDDLPIKKIEDIQGYVLLNNLGSTVVFYEQAEINLTRNALREVPELDIQKAIGILQRKMGDVYAYSDISVESVLQESEIQGIKHFTVEPKEQASVLIFSKHSPFYKEKLNPRYNPNKPPSPQNLPYTLDENSIAYKFQQALKEMKINGEIDAILDAQSF